LAAILPKEDRRGGFAPNVGLEGPGCGEVNHLAPILKRRAAAVKRSFFGLKRFKLQGKSQKVLHAATPKKEKGRAKDFNPRSGHLVALPAAQLPLFRAVVLAAEDV
jgi:hypothetical protein